MWGERGISPMELLAWPAALIEGFQVADVLESPRNLSGMAASNVISR
jgi:hypothetical protein